MPKANAPEMYDGALRCATTHPTIPYLLFPNLLNSTFNLSLG